MKKRFFGIKSLGKTGSSSTTRIPSFFTHKPLLGDVRINSLASSLMLTGALTKTLSKVKPKLSSIISFT